MSIENELTILNTNVQNAYTVCNNKGGKIPSNQNMNNLANCIGSFSINKKVLPREIVNGVWKHSSISSFTLPNNVTEIANRGFDHAFYNDSNLTSANFSSLVTIKNNGFKNAFTYCSNLTNLDFSSLETIGIGAFQFGLQYCTNLVNLNFPSVISISSSAFSLAFQHSTSLTTIRFPSLTTITGSYIFQSAFSDCTNLTDIYFNSLTTSSFGNNTNQFYSMFQSTGKLVTHTIHFPSNLESTISGLNGYPNFSGTSGYVVLAFDLPATE